MHLELLVFDEDLDSETFIDFTLDIEVINGWYNSVDDDDIVNIVSYGQVFSVKKSHTLMNQLNHKLN
jgi:hypothetical protein